MTNDEITVRFIRLLAALHAGAAAFLFMPRSSTVSPLLPAVTAACVVFAYALRFTRHQPPRDVFLRGYAGPVAALAAAHVLWNSPASWEQAGSLLRTFAAAVVLGPHPFVYLGCLAFACLSAPRPKPPSLYR